MGCMKEIYLDHNSTTPILAEVANAVAECYRAGYVNPASQHQPGQRSRRVLETARDAILQILGGSTSFADADRLIFTSGGTEANNLAIRGLIQQETGNIVVSSIEHPSVMGAAEHLQQIGFEIRRLAVSSDGVVKLDELEKLLDDQTQLVSVMLGNNETGVLQPVQEVAEICRRARVPCHCDAVQAVGKMDVNFRELGVSAMSIAAHKFHGPRGIGALAVRSDASLNPILFGGFQQMGLRPGTESVALAVGMGKALELWTADRNDRATQMTELRDRLESRISSEIDDVVVIGRESPRLPHTSNISFPGLDRQAVLLALDHAGVACSTGSACSSGSSEPSPVLLAMGCPKDVVEGSIRISLGCTTTAAEADEAARRIIKTVSDLQQRKETRISSRGPRQSAQKRL